MYMFDVTTTYKYIYLTIEVNKSNCEMHSRIMHFTKSFMRQRESLHSINIGTIHNDSWNDYAICY